jgi:hypothetical protein
MCVPVYFIRNIILAVVGWFKFYKIFTYQVATLVLLNFNVIFEASVGRTAQLNEIEFEIIKKQTLKKYARDLLIFF